MTSKEAVLELICEAKSVNFDNDRICFLRGLIEKDLEVLKIFKNNEISISYIEQSKSYDDYISKCDHFRCLYYITEKEYTLLKECLENDNR